MNQKTLKTGSKSTYQTRMLKLFGANILRYWPLSDSVANVVKDVSAAKDNGSSANVTLGQPGPNKHTSSSFNGTNSYGNVYSAALSAAFPGAAGSLMVWVKSNNWADATYHRYATFYVDGNNTVELYTTGASNVLAHQTAGATDKLFGMLGTQQPLFTAGWNHVALTWTKAGDKACGYLNGSQQVNPRTALGTWAGSLNAAAACIGAFNTSGLDSHNGFLSDAILLNRVATPAEILQAANRTSLVSFDGDSRTYGTAVTAPYPMLILSARPILAGVNYGVAGAKLTDMTTNAPANIDSKLAAGKSIVTLWGGVNDVVGGGVDAAAVHTRISTYCAARHAANFRVAVCTEIDCQDASRNAVAWHATILPALNTLIRANWSSYADVLVDLAADARLMDATNATYFNADNCHLTDTSNAIVQALFSAAL